MPTLAQPVCPQLWGDDNDDDIVVSYGAHCYGWEAVGGAYWEQERDWLAIRQLMHSQWYDDDDVLVVVGYGACHYTVRICC